MSRVNACKGKPRSEETKLRISLAQKIRHEKRKMVNGQDS